MEVKKQNRLQLIVIVSILLFTIISCQMGNADTNSENYKYYTFSNYSLSFDLSNKGEYDSTFHLFGEGQLSQENLTILFLSLSISLGLDNIYYNSNLKIPEIKIHGTNGVDYSFDINVASKMSQISNRINIHQVQLKLLIK